MNVFYAQNSDYLFMIEQATKAPSGHNTQPWLFKMNETSIEIHPNFEKSLPVVDFDNRELFVSLGCATENLCIAASHKGYKSDVDIAENGIITISLQKEDIINPNPLFNAIASRQTNRSVYNEKIISRDMLDVLKQIPLEKDINVFFYKNGTQEFDSISSYVLKGNTVQMENRAFREELKCWMRFNKKHQNSTNDGLSYAVFKAPNLPMFISKPIISKMLNVKSQNKGDNKKMKSSSHFVLFTTKSNTMLEWIRLGIAMERFLLKTTEQGILHAYMNQPNEVRDLSVEMAESLCIDGFPTILLRIGYGEKMPYSKRIEVKKLIIQD